MSQKKYRLVTRSDFDGLICAVLLNELEMIDEIKFVTIADQPTNVGRKLLEAVDRIGQNPAAYVEFRDPDRLGMPERGPWDYEPIHRQGEYTHRF